MKPYSSMTSRMGRRHSRGGFTIVEVTLVLAIILGLAAILFLGLSAYKQGSDKARCILNLSTIQKSVRSCANLDSLNVGDACTVASLQTENYLNAASMPICPKDGSSYVYLGTIPAVGTAYATCPNAAIALGGHAPSVSTVANW